ncbi:MAG: 3-oxoacid CoA-transferase subunit B [Desulfobacterales bacterium]|nr:3-oxoacid CoA-transferase subunit B [Desulfobacterales bacterium]
MSEKGLTRELMCLRAVEELREGMYVNLGIGIPTQVANFIPDGMEVFLHAENGVLNYGGILSEEESDHEYVNAGGQPISLKTGACLFHTADAFAMMRGRRLDMSIIGAFQVSEKGDVANWKTKGDPLGTVGGAMDLAFGAKKVMVLMEHTEKDGTPRIVRQCSLPVTGRGAVNAIITNLAYIELVPEGLLLKEVVQGVSSEEIQALTEPRLIIAPELKEMSL